ncbi:hypothetical protein ISS42_02285 [Candidatus Shapirobacteria bacterium]|nr:hypothetical protein [Candidatus Shapirobacteria bacterium]
MLIDFLAVFYWWFILLILGVLTLPLTLRIFGKFWDKGWVLGKTLGLISLSYVLFLLGRFRLFPFFQETIFIVLLIWAGLVFWRQKDNFKAWKEELLSVKKIILIEEGLFLLALLFWSYVRAFQPSIEGLEKFMDYGFMNSILRSDFFPPKDMWFANSAINYYYFGQLQAAVLTKLSGLDSAITYNLMMATTFALTLVSGFSLASNLVFFRTKEKKDKLKLRVLIGAGLISALLLSLGGNLHAVTYVLKNGASKYWYPDATRFIGYNPNNPNDKTIHEFPGYSFVVADLHGHMNAIPTVLLFISALLALGLALKESKKRKPFSRSRIISFAFPGFLLGLMYMTNSWDLPIYGILLAVFLFGFWVLGQGLKAKKRLVAFKQIIGWGLVALLVAIVTALPFALDFNPMTEGIGLVRARTLWWQFLVLWGFFWFLTSSFWAVVIKRKLGVAEWLVLGATILALVLIIIPEIIYVKDIYIPEYHRANTMFKLVYQSFVIYAVLSGFMVIKVKEFLENRKHYLSAAFFFILFLLGFSAHLIYPYFSIKGYYGSLRPSRFKGLYGLNFLKERYPGDYQTVLWIKENIKGQPTILEAVGDSYTLYDRVSAMTGLPTIEGWLVHEWLWRGGYDQPGARAAEVDSIYQGEDLQKAKKILDKYEVKYVVVGILEKEKYPNLDEERFLNWGKLVFSSAATKLYKLEE